MLSKTCPNLKSIFATCHPKELKGYFLRTIGLFFPFLINLQLDVHSQGYLDIDYFIVGKSQICLNDDDLIDTLAQFKYLKYLGLYKHTFETEKTINRILNMGIEFDTRNLNHNTQNTDSINHRIWFEK